MRETDIGDIAESNFIARCISLGYICCVPQNSNTIYDLILDSKSRIYKVQVKCTSRGLDGNRRNIKITKGSKVKTKYTSSEVDLFAIYIMEEDEWYLIPYESVNGLAAVSITPGGKYEMYRDAFHLL